MKVNEGDIVLVDESLEFSLCGNKFTAIVLWNCGFNRQPLLTKIDKWKPQWATYKSIVKVIDHIDLNRTELIRH